MAFTFYTNLSFLGDREKNPNGNGLSFMHFQPVKA